MNNPNVVPLANITSLADKAVLVQLKKRVYSPYIIDREETDSYGAGNVNKHLFQGSNRVKDTISEYNAVYVYMKENTLPWATGVDMLNIHHYQDFTLRMRSLMATARHAADVLESYWDDEVRHDLARLTNIAQATGKPNLANVLDYPDAQEMRSRFSLDIRFLPVPSTGDFRVGISDEDKDSLQRQLDDAATNAATHVIKSMMEPMRKAVERLKIPVGSKGSVFRDSLIDNLVDVSERMNTVNISDDPAIQTQINDLRSLISVYASNKDVLRSSDVVRRKAVNQIDSLVKQMAGFA